MKAADHLAPLKKARADFHRRGVPFPPHILLERAGRPVLIAWAGECDKDVGLHACPILRAAFDPDAIVFAADCYVREVKSPTAADVEAAYTRGSFQKAVRANARGDIRDALAVTRVTRTGDADFATVKYTLFEANDPVYWDEPAARDDAQATGLIVDALRRAMTGPSLRDRPPFSLLARAFTDLPPERLDAQFRLASLAALACEGFTIMGDGAEIGEPA